VQKPSSGEPNPARSADWHRLHNGDAEFRFWPDPNLADHGASKIQDDMACPACQASVPSSNHYCGFCGIEIPVVAEAAKNPSSLRQSRPPGMDPAFLVEELQFLRSRAISDPEDAAHHGWLYLVAGLATLLAGFLAFAHYYKPPVSLPAQSAAAEPAQRQTSPPDSASQVQAAPTSQADSVLRKPTSDAPAVRTPEQTPLTTRDVVKPAARIVNTSTHLPVDNGTDELLRAERYLDGADGPRDATRAADWLWKSVAKQNSTAATLLSDLYLRGEGVPKSCAQARILLTAAAGKGFDAASQKLRTLNCQ